MTRKPLTVTNDEAKLLRAVMGYFDATGKMNIRGVGVRVSSTDISIGPVASPRQPRTFGGSPQQGDIPTSTIQGQVYQALADGGVDGWDFPLGHE